MQVSFYWDAGIKEKQFYLYLLINSNIWGIGALMCCLLEFADFFMKILTHTIV